MVNRPRHIAPARFQNIQELRERINDYFDSCWEEQLLLDKDGYPIWRDPEKKIPFINRVMIKNYTMSGLALFLGTTRDTLRKYEWGDQGSELQIEIIRAKERIHEYVENKLLTKGENPIGIIFHLKNNFGWKDAPEKELKRTVQIDKVKDLLGEVVTVEQLKESEEQDLFSENLPS